MKKQTYDSEIYNESKKIILNENYQKGMGKNTSNIDNYMIHYFDFGRKRNKNKIYIQSQLHGNETFSTLVILELKKLLEKTPNRYFNSFIRLVPRINPYSWHEYLYNGNGRLNPANGKDWNRSFEWGQSISDNSFDRNTTLSNLTFSLIKDFNFIWDIHTPENGIEHLYCNHFSTDKSYFGIENIIEYGEPTIYSLDEACTRLQKQLNINEAITIELPSHIHAQAKNVLFWADRLYRELISRGFVHLKIDNHVPITRKFRVGQWVDYYADKSGIIQYNFELGELIQTGAELFNIIPFDYINDFYPTKNTFEGYPICIRSKSMVDKGNWVVRVLKVDRYEYSTT
ncbi:MAG: succinylglutamate desuccinylase/aspartoacylase family protein [Candidatus Cloacimonetes bacterium]|nr:succinylglutamate desuccinylase/aspartoacylase family protein [Candidatus Cloacimonadota bacterium]